MAAPARAAPVTPEALRFGPQGGIPNHPDLPALLYRGAVAVDADAICALYRANGWGGTWRWTVYDYHHWHPDAHEALTVATGWAEICLGGPGGTVVRVAAGDAVVLPAGLGHKREAASADFEICGAYPPGQSASVWREDACPMDEALALVRRVPLPLSDPLFGADGPLLAAWA